MLKMRCYLLGRLDLKRITLYFKTLIIIAESNDSVNNKFSEKYMIG